MKQRTSYQFIIKENRSSQCLSYKDSKEGGGGKRGVGGGGGVALSQAVGRTGGAVWVYETGLK